MKKIIIGADPGVDDALALLRKNKPRPNVNVVMDIDSRYYLNDFIKTITK